MGYLDKQSRVIDFILTERGRQLFAIGQLDFAYFSLFDDGIDYDPYYSGTLTDAAREEQIEATAMLEVPFIKNTRSFISPLEPQSHIFTAAANYDNIPSMNIVSTGSIELSCNQFKNPSGMYSRMNSNIAAINLSVNGDAEPGKHIFLVEVFSSGSNGLSLLELKRDIRGKISADPYISLAADNDSLEATDSTAGVGTSKVSRAQGRKA